MKMSLNEIKLAYADAMLSVTKLTAHVAMLEKQLVLANAKLAAAAAKDGDAAKGE